MLSIFFGDMPEAIYNTSVYFKNQYKEKWITDELSVEMIKSVDRSEVLDANAIKSPVLGIISPVGLSGGVKTLILIANDKKHIFNASTCGDNCAKWILKIAEDRDVTINLRHIMDFGKKKFKIKVLNIDEIVTNMEELLHSAYKFV
ncbi:MAG: DUF4869 domain-containing protein [Ruminococcus sp.]|nr:DUF4869 domain-containing protein [Ruminococcus sp.]